MKIKSKDFCVPVGKEVDLKKWPRRVKPIYKSKKNYHQLLESQVTALSALQRPDCMKAYEACLGATSTNDAPWHVVPADDKKNARLIISEMVLDVFKGLKMAYPEPTVERRRELQLIRKTLVK